MFALHYSEKNRKCQVRFTCSSIPSNDHTGALLQSVNLQEVNMEKVGKEKVGKSAMPCRSGKPNTLVLVYLALIYFLILVERTAGRSKGQPIKQVCIVTFQIQYKVSPGSLSVC